jgi:hypothetical protein
MGRADFYQPGDWNAVCFECGRKKKASQMKRHWQGYYLCPEHWEVRQPQDFVRGVADPQALPWSQPMPGDTFGRMCTPNGVSAVPGSMEPGCIVPGYLSPMYNPESDI